MVDADLKILTEGVKLFVSGLYWDAIEKFQLVAHGRDDSLKDDATLNLGICYMKLGLYAEAKSQFMPLYRCEVGDNRFVDDTATIGTPRDRATLGLFRIALADADYVLAKKLIDEMEASGGGVLEEGRMTSFHELAKKELNDCDTDEKEDNNG